MISIRACFRLVGFDGSLLEQIQHLAYPDEEMVSYFIGSN